jgi:hypothetical protein
MRFFRGFVLVGIAGLLAACGAAPVGSGGNQLDRDLALMMEWFPGEYDNHEQVWQQGVDGIDKKDQHEHIHHIFLPVDAPKIGEHVFFVKQYSDGNYEDVYRQRLYKFTRNDEENAVQLTIYRFLDEQRYRYTDRAPELVGQLDYDQLKTTEGCEVYWRYTGEFFHGYMHEGACSYRSPRSGQKITITDTLKLTEDEIWIGDKAYDEDGNKIFGRDEQHKNRKVRYFKGWMGLKREKIDPDAGEDDWVFDGNFRIHSEGQVVPLVAKDGSETGYSVQLAQLTYQNTTDPILKLGVIEDATGKTVTYIWGETGATQLGMNLRWFQVGLKEER